MNQERDPKDSDQSPIEGGEVKEFGDLEFHEKKHRAETARLLAIMLICILGGTWVIHYGVVVVLLVTDNSKGIEELGKVFHAWLPVLSGFVGAAITYYFTKE